MCYNQGLKPNTIFFPKTIENRTYILITIVQLPILFASLKSG